MSDMPLFVKIDKYNKILEHVTNIKTMLHDAEALLTHLEELKHEEDSEIERWKTSLESVGSKIETVQSALTQAHDE